MLISILTIFPDFFSSCLNEGIVRRAVRDGLVAIEAVNIRDFATDRHSMTDDRPFGGGEGMVMKPEPLAAAIRAAREKNPAAPVILMSPQGRSLDHSKALELSREPGLILVCGRYEGVDQRIIDRYIDMELSIGDYVLSGGEPAALVVVDAVVRLIPGALGCGESASSDTFSRNLLKHPQYTRPREFEGEAVPDVLLSGDHDAIRKWRFIAAVRRTLERRPDLLAGAGFSEKEKKLLVREGLWQAVSMAAEDGRRKD